MAPSLYGSPQTRSSPVWLSIRCMSVEPVRHPPPRTNVGDMPGTLGPPSSRSREIAAATVARVENVPRARWYTRRKRNSDDVRIARSWSRLIVVGMSGSLIDESALRGGARAARVR